MSDTGLSSAAAGLDVAMPSSSFWGVDGGYLTQAVKNGSLAESRVTDMATRLVASWYQMGQDVGFPARGVGMPSIFYTPHPPVYARDPSSKQFLIDGALEGHVLVKNVNNALPLKKPKLLSVYGYDAPSPLEMNVGGLNDFIGGTWLHTFHLWHCTASDSIQRNDHQWRRKWCKFSSVYFGSVRCD